MRSSSNTAIRPCLANCSTINGPCNWVPNMPSISASVCGWDTPGTKTRCGIRWAIALAGSPRRLAQVQYIEALFAAIPQDRITGGVSVRDVLPGVDLDLFAGGMFEESQTFGITTATVESYWVGTGITWRFGRGGCSEDECK